MATGFDLIGLFLIVIMAVSGLKKGLIDGVLKLVGIYAAVYAAMNYNQYGTVFLEPLINIPEAYKTPAGFVIVFLVTMYSITFISYLLRKLVKTMHLGAVDRIGGITFGALKAGLILSAVVWAFAMVPETMRGTWQKDSKLYPVVEIFAGQMVYVLSLEDELALLQNMMDPDADKTALLQMALGGKGGMGLLTGSGEDGMGGMGNELMQNETIRKALESLDEPQQAMIMQAMEAMRTGNAQSLMEGAIQSKDSTGASLMDKAMEYMNPAQKQDLHKRIKEIDAEMQSSDESTVEDQY